MFEITAPPRAVAIFKEMDGEIVLIDQIGMDYELAFHLTRNPPLVSGDTHIAEFYRSAKTAGYGTLQNEMPGSNYCRFAFERRDFCVTLGKKLIIIVGRYW